MGDGQAPLDIGGFSHVCIGVTDMERSIELIELPAGLTSSVELWRGPGSA